jgi:23S rRNA (cytosine1962-C5)-methyltransferase
MSKIPDKAIILKPGREKSVLRRHPWVFSGALKEVVGSLSDGDVVPVYSAENQFLAQIAYSHTSQIAGRIWTFSETDKVDVSFLRARISAAVQYRSQLGLKSITNAVRIVHAESDGIPGLVVDQYADVLVAQFLSYGVEVWRDEIGQILLGLTKAKTVYERSDAEVRGLEGLPDRIGPLVGSSFNDPVEIDENGIRYLVPISSGHKTGFYLDQRANRMLLRSMVDGLDVLDCFCYSGGFSLNALVGGAKSVTAVDVSQPALDLLKKNAELNDLDPEKLETLQADVFQQLRKFRDQRWDFDVIILDPPKFAPTRSHAQKAARGYKDINLLAFKLLRPGGLLFTFSCSGGIDNDLFQKIVAGAALDAGVQVQIVGRMSQDMDHPVGMSFPEGEYLKGLICRVV